MKKDYAFGAIVFKNDNGVEKVLLIKKPQFESYDLPKGHKEGDETDQEAALREVSEETGYKNIVVTNNFVSVSYESEKNGEKLDKTITFYLATHEGVEENPEQNLDQDEDEQGVEVHWIPVNDASNLLTFVPFKSALEQAIQKRNLV